eukprot:TRINITY_DN9071_c0_g3_i2.p1 TRINITY_DN9071_c0_g3~~TRINITY_DN9071_c0_g3_i2.p1  ORF type:complete len:301 (-),score=27.23 TRINITY_DN9071_c0_g3_i2:10-912(-)
MKIKDFTDKLSSWGNIISIFFSIVGIAVIFVLPLLDRKAFHDENALLTNRAHSKITHSKILTELKNSEKLQCDRKNTLKATNFPFLEIYQQQFEICSQLSCKTCINEHGILRANRGDGLESILIVSENYGLNLNSNCGSFGFIGKLMEYLVEVQWLAKDIIWLVTDQGNCGAEFGAQAWARKYAFNQDGIKSSAEFGRAGGIQQAIVLTQIDEDWDSVVLTMEGYEGILPQLDLVYLVKHVLEFQNIQVTLQNENQPLFHLPIQLLRNKNILQYVQRYLANLIPLNLNLNMNYRICCFIN